MTAATLSVAPGLARQPFIGTKRVDHWAPAQRAPRQADKNWTVERWSTAASIQVAAAVAATPLADPWSTAYARAYRQAIAQELTVGEWLRARWSAFSQRRAQARADAEIRAQAAHDPRMLRDLQIARDLAEWQPQR